MSACKNLHFDSSCYGSQTQIKACNGCMTADVFVAFPSLLKQSVLWTLTKCVTNFTMLSSSLVSPLILFITASKSGAYFWNLPPSFDTKKNVFVSTGASVPYPVHQMHAMVYSVVMSPLKMFMSCFSFTLNKCYIISHSDRTFSFSFQKNTTMRRRALLETCHS